MNDPIIKTIDVPCGPETAFDVFVTRISAWWPLDGHAVSAASGQAALGVTIEPEVGGAVYETMFDGARSDWGKVLEFEPGRKLAMTWHPGTNIDKPTRVDVTFEQIANGHTRVTLTHSGWEIWGDAAAEKRGMYNGGWDFVFGERYADAASC